MEDRAKLFKKMSGVMGRMDRIEKRGHNNFFNYDFVTSDDVIDAVRKAMVAEGLAFYVNLMALETAEIPDKTGKLKTKHVATFEFSIADTETGTVLACIWKGEAMDTEDKAIAKCATSAEKYFLLKTFLIGTGDDPDPDGGDDTGKPAAVKRPETKTQHTNKPPEPAQPTEPEPATPEIPEALMHLSGICTSEGEPYVLLTTEKLVNRSIGLNTLIKKNELTDRAKSEAKAKLECIKEILVYRDSH